MGKISKEENVKVKFGILINLPHLLIYLVLAGYKLEKLSLKLAIFNSKYPYPAWFLQSIFLLITWTNIIKRADNALVNFLHKMCVFSQLANGTALLIWDRMVTKQWGLYRKLSPKLLSISAHLLFYKISKFINFKWETLF